jgi:hypothetical protein
MQVLRELLRELWWWPLILGATILLHPWWSASYPYPTDLAAIGFIAAIGPLGVLRFYWQRRRERRERAN